MNEPAFALAVLALSVPALISVQAQEPGATEIWMPAKKYEFSPNVVTVKKGDHVKLVITSLDRMHGTHISGYDIQKKLPQDEPVAIEFVADKAGLSLSNARISAGWATAR